MFFRALNACLCIVIGMALISENGQARAGSEVLSTKDGDSDRIVSVLQELVNGAIDHESRRGSYEMSGVIQPGNRAFHYLQQGEKAKFEVDWNSPKGNVKCYRIDDGKQFLKLDDTSLTIHPIKNRTNQWNGLCDELSRYSAPLFYDRSMCVSERCQWLIDCLQRTGPSETVELGTLLNQGAGCVNVEVSESGNVVIVDFVDNHAPRNPVFSMEIARDRGYSLSKYAERDGNIDPLKWTYQLDVKNEYREFSPGLWFLNTGERRISDTGSFAKSSGRIPEQMSRIEVADVRITNENSDQAFLISSLPVPKGANIEDYRLDPPMIFRYSEGGVEESLLKKRLQSQPRRADPPPKSYRIWILLVNAVVVLSALAWRYASRRQQRPIR